MITPDFLFAALPRGLLHPPLALLRQDRFQDWFFPGLIHDLAFLAKAFALPWLAVCTLGRHMFVHQAHVLQLPVRQILENKSREADRSCPNSPEPGFPGQLLRCGTPIGGTFCFQRGEHRALVRFQNTESDARRAIKPLSLGTEQSSPQWIPCPRQLS